MTNKLKNFVDQTNKQQPSGAVVNSLCINIIELYIHQVVYSSMGIRYNGILAHIAGICPCS